MPAVIPLGPRSNRLSITQKKGNSNKLPWGDLQVPLRDLDGHAHFPAAARLDADDPAEAVEVRRAVGILELDGHLDCRADPVFEIGLEIGPVRAQVPGHARGLVVDLYGQTGRGTLLGTLVGRLLRELRQPIEHRGYSERA